MKQSIIALLLIVPALLAPTWVAGAEVINVADHGIVPGKDVAFAVNRLIESVRDRDSVTLRFPKGRYDFHPENAVERYRAVANHDNGLKRLGFPLFDCRNITIDGGGSMFMFHGRMVPITIGNVDGATLKNFSIDWIRSFHAELTVVETAASDLSFVVETDREAYPYSVKDGEVLFHRFGQDDPIGSNIVFDPSTRAPIHSTGSYSVNSRKAKVTEAGKNRFRIAGAVKSVPPVGSVLVVYGVHPTSRLCPAIHVTNSQDLKIENVTVHEAGGMALIVERTNNVSLDHMVVTSASDRLAATRADATHFIGCKGTITLENCLLEHMLDDGINVHGAYVKVEKHLGEREFLCEISHFQQWGMTFAEPGDRVALLSRDTILPFAETTVESIKVLNEHRFVMTVADVPPTLPDGPMSVENLTWYPDLVMRNNTIRENRARSVLVTTKGKVLIENNHFSSQMHGILIEGDNNKWYESGAVGDVTIRNNVFENIGYAVSQRYPLLAAPLLNSEQRMGEGHYHRNIRFAGNTIKSFNGLLVQARSVSGLTIEGNQLQISEDYPKADEGPAIDLEYCDDVVIRDNKVSGFDTTLSIEQSSDTGRVKIGSNIGLKRAKATPTTDQGGSTIDSTKPNIVLLFVDDLGWSDLGYRNPKFETPHIDQFASESLDFQQAYIASPTCSPSRGTLLTGKHPARLQLVRHIPNDAKHGFDESGRTDEEFNFWEGDPAKFPCRNWLPLEHTTYAEALGELGYHSQFLGKWHLGHEPYHPIRQGFDGQIGTTNAGHPKSYLPPFFKNSEVFASEHDRYLTDKLTDESIAFIEKYDRDQPFMLSLWYYNVHRPPVGRPDLVNYFEAKGYNKVDAIYAAQVKAVDESVGRIRQSLMKRGIDKNTIVLFLSDQGSWYDNTPLRGTKRVDTLCEGGARVPLLIHWPGVTKPNSKNNSVVQSTDLFPTFVQMAGGDPSKHEGLDGVSLTSVIRNNSTLDRGAPIFGYRAYEDLYASVRDGDWKLLAYRSGKVNLYNIADDECEQNDLAQTRPAIVTQLTAGLIEWEKRMSVEKYSGVQ